ncbi:MAG: hypothetical protein HC866_09605 [Leptolyngbyaceae cyanobacterium RU_5_1]|nr:hypothetical protein [Leptolyngbyaceae cyanobacterium RU_5_1]
MLIAIKKTAFTLIKVISVVLISGAIGLEAWNLYAILTNRQVPSSLNPVFWIERFAVISHLIEGLIAAYYAPSRNKMPIQYGTYTFFVGTVGLLELFLQEPEP